LSTDVVVDLLHTCCTKKRCIGEQLELPGGRDETNPIVHALRMTAIVTAC
jgi:hypothetical protein